MSTPKKPSSQKLAQTKPEPVEIVTVELSEEDQLVIEGFHVAHTIFRFAERVFLYSRKHRK